MLGSSGSEHDLRYWSGPVKREQVKSKGRKRGGNGAKGNEVKGRQFRAHLLYQIGKKGPNVKGKKKLSGKGEGIGLLGGWLLKEGMPN